MFDNYIFTKDSFRNIEKGGWKIGYEVSTLIPYYRGIPLSMVHDLEVATDGKPEPKDSLRFSPDGEHWFGLSEMETVTAYKWEYGRQGRIRVLRPEGLPKGEHEIKLTVTIRVAYIPVPFSGSRTRQVKV